MSILYRLRIFVLFLICLAIFAPLFTVEVQASPTTWIIETVDASADVGYYNSIVVDSDDFPHIAYYDRHWENLKYATPSRVPGPDWVISPLDTVGKVGIQPSLALDSTGSPHISYTGYNPQNTTIYLKYLTWNGTAYATEIIDSTPADYGESSIVLDSNDNPHISYYGGPSDGDLKYASWDGAIWSIETVDSTGKVGDYSSLALDSNGISHISYYDSTNKHLKYAYWTGTTWFTETVDASTTVGYFNSIALDSNDNPHISYWDWTNWNLKYARYTGTAWSIETVDASAHVGGGTSLALDWLDRPHTAYYDDNWKNLKYARWFGGTWIIEVVDHVGDVGWDPSLALDSEGKPHISYYDDIADNLKYASTSNEYFASVNVTPFDSDSDGQNDAVEIQMDVDTSYSGVMPVHTSAFLVDPFSYHADYNSTSWEITGQSVEWMYSYLYVPPGYADGPAMYSVELTLLDDGDFIEDFHHETDIYLYPASTPPPTTTIESCNSIGEHKDVFELGETVFVNGSGFSPSTGYIFYIVVDQEIWTDGMTIPERVPGTEPSILSNVDGDIDPTDMWHNPQTVGDYDIIVDVNGNGQYDVGVDALDDGDVELVAGLSVIPELSSILLPLFMIATLSVAILFRRKHPPLQTANNTQP